MINSQLRHLNKWRKYLEINSYVMTPTIPSEVLMKLSKTFYLGSHLLNTQRENIALHSFCFYKI